MESDFNPSAGASTSSAHGLFQFIEQTWLGTVKEAGSQLGYGQYSDAISKTSSGSYTVSDPATRKAIMKLRDDPVAASAMAGVLTQSNSFQLTGQIGRRPTDGELYMAHFMGVGGAAKLINSAEDNPQASAARLFPNAAAANRSIFYDRQGGARSVSDVYSVLTSRYAGAANSPATQTALAMYGNTPPASRGRKRRAARVIDRQRRLSLDIPECRCRKPGHGRIERDVGQRPFIERPGIPLAVPGRRPVPTGLVDGSRLVGQFRLADVGRKRRQRCPGDERWRAAAARSLQRSQRHLLKLAEQAGDPAFIAARSAAASRSFVAAKAVRMTLYDFR